jgi:hypothetical protein
MVAKGFCFLLSPHVRPFPLSGGGLPPAVSNGDSTSTVIFADLVKRCGSIKFDSNRVD